MKSHEFIDLTEKANPTNVSFDGSVIEITFDNGIIVEVSKTTEWDCAVWEFESNIEKEEKRVEWENKDKEEKQQRKEFDEYRDKVKSKFTPAQWEEIEQAFLYNNGMTFKQNMEIQKDSQSFYQSMQEKYGKGGFYDQLSKSTF